RSSEVALGEESLAVEEKEEKGLVLLDRSTDASTELITVVVILIRALEVVVPRVRIQRRITIDPEQASVKLVCSGARGHLDLAGAASHLGIGGCNDNAHFVHEIGADVGGRRGARVVTPVTDGNTVASGVQLGQAAAGEVAAL